jgi:hypothetical protein
VREDLAVIWPDVPAAEPRMSGSIILEHRKVIVERFGLEVLNEAVASLSEAQRQEFEEVRPSSWVRISTMEAFYASLANGLGRRVADVHVEIGRLAIERTLKTLWRIFLRFTSDEALITRSPVIFSKSFDCGRVESTIPRPGQGVVTLHDWPNVTDFPVRGLCNGITTLLVLAGRNNVTTRVTTRTPEQTVIAVTWDA